MHYGTVVKFFPNKGFGFIRPDFGQDVFFHVTALGACQQQPRIEVGQMVKYELVSSAESPEPPRHLLGDKKSAKAVEPAQPQAMMVELTDSLPADTFRASTPKQPSVRHPRARQKKPTWRR